MNYTDFAIFNPKVEEVANDILCVEFWKPDFCKLIIENADNINQYETRPNDNVPGQELRIDKISKDLYISFCKHWKTVLQPILDEYFLLPAESWFIGWKIPFIIKYEMNKQRYLRPHMDGSLITGTVRMNNDYTGGDLVFPRQKFKNTNVPVGSILLWPSSIQHLHFSDTLLSGTKYTLTAWTKNYESDSGINYKEV